MRHSKDGLQARRVVFRIHAAPLNATTHSDSRSGSRPADNADGTSKIFSVNLRDALSGNPADNLLLQPRDRLLIHRNTLSVDASTVEITGEVAKPGRYPYTGNMRAEDLIRAAGGLKRSADANSADLTRYASPGEPAQQVARALQINPAVFVHAALAGRDGVDHPIKRAGQSLKILGPRDVAGARLNPGGLQRLQSRLGAAQADDFVAEPDQLGTEREADVAATDDQNAHRAS